MDELIPAWDVLTAISKHVVKIPDTAPVLTRLEKRIYTSLTNMRLFDLSNSDVDLLFRLFADSGLDFNFLMSGNCTAADYEPFKKAFYASPAYPGWHIQAAFTDYREIAKGERGIALRSHFDLMTKAAVDGEIALLSQTHVPIFRPESYARITREDAKKYLKKFSLPLSLLDETVGNAQHSLEGVKKLLANQETGFISLQDVLAKMTMPDGASYQEAAKVLYRLLSKTDKQERPQWQTMNALDGVGAASNEVEKFALEYLKNAAIHEELGEKYIPAGFAPFGFKEAEINPWLDSFFHDTHSSQNTATLTEITQEGNAIEGNGSNDKRRNRLYNEVLNIKDWKKMSTAKILSQLRDVAGTSGSCVQTVGKDSITWLDLAGNKQITLFTALGKWLTRNQN